MDDRPKNSFSMSYASRKVIFPREYTELRDNPLIHCFLYIVVRHIPSGFDCILRPQYLFSILFALLIGWINLEKLAAALIYHCAAVCGSLMPLSSFISDWLSVSQSSSMSFGSSKSQFQWSQFWVSEMVSGAISRSHLAGWEFIVLISRAFHHWVHCPGRSFADEAGGTGNLSQNSIVSWGYFDTKYRYLGTALDPIDLFLGEIHNNLFSNFCQTFPTLILLLYSSRSLLETCLCRWQGINVSSSNSMQMISDVLFTFRFGVLNHSFRSILYLIDSTILWIQWCLPAATR